MASDSSFVAFATAFLLRDSAGIADDYETFERDFRQVLSWPPDRVTDAPLFLSCLRRGFGYFTGTWDRRGFALREACSRALANHCAQPDASLETLCLLFDLSYFLIWCFNDSNDDQCRQILPDMRNLAQRTGRTCPGRLERGDGRLTVVYLTRFADPKSAVSACMKYVLEALATCPDRYRPLVYVLDHMDPDCPAWLAHVGAKFVVLKGATAQETIENVMARARADDVDVMLAANNTAVPTVLFSRRCAPVQGLVQVGLPAWGTLNLDLVYNGFGFDPAKAGWGDAAVYDFLPPWDVDDLKGAPSANEIAAEQAKLPPGARAIGCYARLIKVSSDYLAAAERILLANPDVVLLIGGSGDPSAIQRLIAASPARERIVLRPGFVPGRAWARILHLFLDTWPFPGGGSVREVTVHGVPVVSVHCPQIPTLELEKDSELIAADWDGFVELANRLLSDDEAYARARARALDMTRRMADPGRFQRQFLADLERSVEQANQPATS
ncbi:MAG: hypothetical protein P4L76_06235 [Beijerinckiaceae bacterium]|nr:hypothetical protein [Beijerinckiaceae bacterium]